MLQKQFENRLRSGLNSVILGVSGLCLIGLLLSVDADSLKAFRAPSAMAESLDSDEALTPFEVRAWTRLSFPSESSLTRSEIARHLKKQMELNSKAIDRLAGQIEELCRQHRFDPAFVLAVIAVESDFEPRAVSPVGARGLMQIMPATALVVADRYDLKYFGASDLFDPWVNLRIGVQYLEELRGQFSSIVPYFLAAYNIGPARLNQLLNQKGFKPRGLKKYVDDVLKALGRFRATA
jgi:hypothetical protein